LYGCNSSGARAVRLPCCNVSKKDVACNYFFRIQKKLFIFAANLNTSINAKNIRSEVLVAATGSFTL
jgi:hypothetical protein